jgi:hypothetical protein
MEDLVEGQPMTVLEQKLAVLVSQDSEITVAKLISSLVVEEEALALPVKTQRTRMVETVELD